MNRVGSLNNKEQMEEMTQKSIESRKANGNKAGKKQAVTLVMKNAFFDCPSRAAYKNKHLKASAVDYIIEQMFGKGGEWCKEFIESQLNEAKNNPNSRAADRLAGGLFNEALWDQLDIYLNKANADDVGYELYKIRETLFDRQQEVFDDKQDKRILIINSRRSGKTELLGRLALKNLISVPDAHVVYLNRTSAAAIRQIRGPLESALKNSNLRIIKGSVESQELHFSNGSQMLVLGNNNASDIDRLRGERISLCILDECGHQRNMAQLIREVISPALMDYEGSQLVMVGTPPRIPHTYVEQCYENPKWKKFHWTFQDNPHLKDKENVIKEACEEAGVDENSAFIQREYFGRMDAFDDDAKWIKKYSVVDEVQVRNTTTIWDYCWIGVDWGYEDLGAIITVLADRKSKRAFVVNSWSKAKTGVDEKAKEIQRQIDWVKENYVLARPPMVICDPNNKEAISDLFHVYKIPNIFGAYKYDKDLALDQLADFLASNKISFLKDRSDSLITDCENTLWKRDEETDKILHEIDDDVWHPNALMALLYISRQFAFDVLKYVDNNKTARPLERTEDFLDEDGHIDADTLNEVFKNRQTKYQEEREHVY